MQSIAFSCCLADYRVAKSPLSCEWVWFVCSQDGNGGGVELGGLWDSDLGVVCNVSLGAVLDGSTV